MDVYTVNKQAADLASLYDESTWSASWQQILVLADAMGVSAQDKNRVLAAVLTRVQWWEP
jgi:hypothetical protein